MNRTKRIACRIYHLMVCFGIVISVTAQNNTRPTVPLPNGFEVNSYTGNLFHTRTDFQVPGKGMPIDISFSYNVSRRAKDWGMGRGWTFSYNMAYATDSLGLWIERPDGKRELFRHIGSAYVAPAGVFDTLVEYQSGKYYLRTKDNRKFFFESASHKRLTKIQDLNNNTIQIAYASDSLIQSITDASGHMFEFTWQAGRLSEINDHSCAPFRKVRYEYDTSGNPVKVYNPLNDFVQYYYDTTHKVIGYTDESNRSMSMVYNASGAVAKVVSCVTNHQFSYVQAQFKTYVTETVNGQRNVTTYQFDTLGKVINKKGNCCGFNVSLEYDQKTNVTKRIDGKGNFTLLEYDAHGNVTKETDMQGNFNVYAYNLTTNLLTSRKDKNGNTTTFDYDANGNLTVVHKPLSINEISTYDGAGNKLSFKDGNDKTTNYEYNTSGYLTKVTDAAGGVTEFTYDCHGNKLTQKDANNHLTSFEYNALNQLVKITNALGQQIVMTYDKSGNLKTLKNPLNKTTTYDYDGIDRLVKVTTPLGITRQIEYDEQGNVIRQIDGNGRATEYTYNSRKQVLTETDALGHTITYDYDESGNRTSMTNKRNGTTQYEYNNLDQLIKVTNPLGGTRTINYDAVGNKLSEIDANGNITAYQYDALNRLIKITDPYNKTIEYTYDGADSKLSEKDKRLHTTSFLYDNVNRVISITNPLSGQQQFTYDAVGNKLTEKDELNHTTTFTYTALNQLSSSSNALGEVTAYTYDGAGNRLTSTLPNGNVLTNVYDEDNRLTAINDQLGAISTFTYDNNSNLLSEKDGNNHTTSYTYDALNRKVKETDAMGKFTQYAYDANGNIMSVADRNNHITAFTYDLQDRKLTETDASGGVTNYSYDANGNLVSITDARSNTTGYSYDALNRLKQETYANGSNRFFTYDGNSNMLTRKDQMGVITTYTYDDLDRMTSRSYPGGATETFSYDATGKVLTANNTNANLSFTYDNANRQLSETLNGKTTGYAYNIANGTRTITYPGGRVITEEFDDRDRLNTVKDGGTNLASFTYDVGNRVQQKTYSNGSVTNYAYNDNDWVSSLSSTPANAVSFTYTFDFEGNRTTALKTHHASNSEAYAYDVLDRVANYKEGSLVAGNIPAPLTQTQYNYDGVGNRTSVVKDATTTNYLANNVNAYLKVAADTMLYSANGNTTNDGSHSYTYDYENRIVAVDTGATATYKYDAFGRRVQKVTPAATINYYFDGDRVIEERNAANITQATYVYGSWVDDILSMKRNGNDYFYLHNSLGSVVAIGNSSGAVVERYEYDAYGKVTFYNGLYNPISASVVGNNYLFTGRELDIESGNYFYRARHYNPKIGRFLQRDPLGYVDGMNLYEYTGGSTLNRIDPYGTDWQTAAVGFGDAFWTIPIIDYNIPSKIRGYLGTNQFVDFCNTNYKTGGKVGSATQLFLNIAFAVRSIAIKGLGEATGRSFYSANWDAIKSSGNHNVRPLAEKVGVILDNTSTGKWIGSSFEKYVQVTGRRVPKRIEDYTWKTVSKWYAKGAKGETNIVLDMDGVSLKSTFLTHEFPMLKNNVNKGITQLKFHHVPKIP